ncbi:MAG TPA: ABC transporter ATP-binding protein [Ruminococcaceae bacterium]|nr:ABC transporter ATP-binding protein [Oscillospiraceae bacterium]
MTEVKYDLDLNSKPCRGVLRYENGAVYALEDGREVFSHSLENVGELVQYTDVGCGSLEISPFADELGSNYDSAENITVCRFSMSAAEDIGEFCKAVNHYIKTGEEPQLSADNADRCPVCGRRYPKGTDVCMFCVDKSYIWRRTFKMLRQFMPTLIVSSVLVTLANLMSAAQPVLQGKLVDSFSSGGLSAKQNVIIIGVAMALTYLLENIFQIFSGRTANSVGLGFSKYLRSVVYDKVQRMSVSSMSRKTAGDLIKRVTRDTNTVQNFFVDKGRYALEQIILFIVVGIFMLRMSPLLTLLAVLPAPLCIIALNSFKRYIHLRYDKQWRYDSRANSILHDIIKGIRVVKTFGSEKREVAKFSSASKALADISVSNERVWAIIFPVIGFFMNSGNFLVLYFGGRMVINGTMTAGELWSFVLLLSYIYKPLDWLANMPRWIAEVTTSLIKIYEVLDEKPQVGDSRNAGKYPITGEVEFDSVGFGYKSYEPVLKDINLKIKPGEMIGLVGHSGAGKSTMINLVMRLYDVDSGTLRIDGRDIRDYDQYYLRENMGVVFQETYLFSGTVYDNIAYAKPDASPEEVFSAAKAANAHGFIMELKDGYNTVVGENGYNLSGGERQRVAIARAILRDPKILILDEATSALDPETESHIQEALGRLVQNRTTIAIAHRLSTLRHADRLVVLENGRIAEVGTHTELLKKRGIYYNLVMAQRQTSKLTSEAQAALDRQ